MEKIRELYETYKVYLTRQNIEIFSVMVIVISALVVFTSSIPSHGVLTLDKGSIKYDGSLVRGKMNGEGTLTFANGDTYKGKFRNGTFNGKGTFTAKAGWTYEGDFVNGQPEGQGTLTTESNTIYKGKFKQGIYQNAH
ncbi:MORN repeat-containing protein [Streptococcus pneumoniae]